MQIDNVSLTVWEDQATNAKRSQLVFEHINDEAFVSLGTGSGAAMRLTNIAVPVVDSDATNKSYVDALIRGLSIKAPVRVVACQPVTLASLQAAAVVDGVALAAQDRVLLVAQADAVENGIYVVGSTAPPARASDLPAGAEATGVYCFVDEGAVFVDRSYICITNVKDAQGQPTNVVGTHALEWVQFGARSAAIAGRGLVTGAANELDVNVDNSTLQITNDTLSIIHPDIKVKVERGFLRTTTDGVSVSAPATDDAAAAVLGYTLPLGQNITLRPDFTVLPDLAAANTFANNNTFTGTVAVGASVAVNGDTQAVNVSTGALTVAGGTGIAKNLVVGGDVALHGAGSIWCSNGYVHTLGLESTATTQSDSVATGAIVTAGGLGVAKDVHVGGVVHAASDVLVQGNLEVTGTTTGSSAHYTATTPSTTAATGALVVDGGAGVALDLHVGGALAVQGTSAITGAASLLSTAESTSTGTGALVVAGGVGVAKRVNVGGDVQCHATTEAAWAAGTDPLAGSLVVEGGAAVRHGVRCETARLHATTDASSVATGALVVDGGAGIAAQLYVGGDAHVVPATPATWTAGLLPGDAPTLTGALQVSGGIAAALGLESLTLHAHATTDSTSVATGAAVVDGGLGVAKTVTCSAAHLVGNTAATSTTTGTLTVAGGVGVNGDLYVNNTFNMSDRRLKDNIQEITNALEAVEAMRGCTFQWNEHMPELEGAAAVGVIAQDIQSAAPLCVTQNPDTTLLAVTYTGLIPYLIQAIKELKRKVDDLSAASGAAVTADPTAARAAKRAKR